MCKRANSTADLQEVWTEEIKLNDVHKGLTGEADQPHNLEKQQHRKVAGTINMVTKNKFQVPCRYKGALHSKQQKCLDTVNYRINGSVGRRKNMDTCQTTTMNKPTGSKWVNKVKVKTRLE
jgi:hypothetical protein